MRVLADDLTGAVEAAAALQRLDPEPTVVLGPARRAQRWVEPGGVAAVDLDIRHTTPDDAAAAVAAWEPWCGTDPAFVKVDSLLRGNLPALLAALEHAGRPIVFAPTHPGLGRIVRNGRPLVAGRALGFVEAWSYEHSPAPDALGDLLAASSRHALLPLGAVRAPGLRRVVADLLAHHAVLCCDAETDADLRAIASAALPLPRVRLVGSAGLAQALAEALAPPVSPPAPPPGAARVLVVNGSRERSAAAQVARLAAAGTPHVAIAAAGTAAAYQAQARAALSAGGAVALSLAGAFAGEPAPAERLATIVGALVARDREVALVALGGRTSRAILDRLDSTSLTVLRTLGDGAIECRTADERRVVTRPGSFGPPDHLLQILGHLRSTTNEEMSKDDAGGARCHDR